ncbi:Hypothetical protein CGLY_11790 [Corynebacterium glyciniphilum AJ 3170]|uniref:Relaxase/mobilization nuclease domain-containing protein n=1 Tax=Corynebacterium glyciniphilum AJ 3170 TaxID=1404245 RepID=X5DNS6_9CORY|nr:hypothetical protein [Corynebacterium glyciniphilum]AHW64803.1 Hypothetical protein CGLY_11790 [Corynebacterium glyciniphilum AJ 3170]
MSVLVGSHVKRGNIRGWVKYCARLDLDDEARAEAVPVVVSNIGEGMDIADNMETLLRGTTRTNGGESLVLSFPAHEMDVNNPEHQQQVGDLAYEAAHRFAPNCPIAAFVHTDSDGGKLHAHIFIGNHDKQTHLSNQRNMKITHLRKINDRLMIENGLEVCTPGKRTRSKTWADIRVEREQAAQRDASNAELLAANPNAKLEKAPVRSVNTPEDIKSRADVFEYLSGVIATETSIQTTAREEGRSSTPVIPESLKKRLRLYGVSMDIKPDNGHGHTITYAAVDSNGKPIKVDPPAGSKRKSQIRVVAKDSKMGTDFTYDGLVQQIEKEHREFRLDIHKLGDSEQDFLETHYGVETADDLNEDQLEEFKRQFDRGMYYAPATSAPVGTQHHKAVPAAKPVQAPAVDVDLEPVVDDDEGLIIEEDDDNLIIDDDREPTPQPVRAEEKDEKKVSTPEVSKETVETQEAAQQPNESLKEQQRRHRDDDEGTTQERQKEQDKQPEQVAQAATQPEMSDWMKERVAQGQRHEQNFEKPVEPAVQWKDLHNGPLKGKGYPPRGHRFVETKTGFIKTEKLTEVEQAQELVEAQDTYAEVRWSGNQGAARFTKQRLEKAYTKSELMIGEKAKTMTREQRALAILDSNDGRFGGGGHPKGGGRSMIDRTSKNTGRSTSRSTSRDITD